MAKSETSDLLGSLGLAILFSAIFILTNIFDWDYVFTTLEVDLRSIVIDGKLPSWSYQMCAGSSRVADPQSYGLSPLMILPILFGSFWGAKSLLLMAAWAGIHYLKKIVRLIFEDISATSLYVSCLAFMFGNYFLFHFSAGHLSFSSVFYAFPLLFLCLKIVSKLNISNSEFFKNSVFLFLLMSGGFYQASIYFVLPLALSFLLFYLLEFKKTNHGLVFKLVCSSLIPLVLSSYRWLPVLNYQKSFPRTLNINEWHGFIDQMLYFISPIHDGLFLVPFRVPMFSAGEDSYFGPIVMILLVLIIVRRKDFFRVIQEKSAIFIFALCLCVVGLSFSFGNKYQILPFSLLNSIFSGSIRVASRFNFITYFAFFMVFIQMLKIIDFNLKARRILNAIVLGLSFLSLLQFYKKEEFDFSLFQLEQIHKVDPIYTEKMQNLHITRMRGFNSSHMYLPTLLGLAVPNCYQPMARSIYFIGEKLGQINKPFDMPFLQDMHKQPKECQEKSFFNQSEISIHPSCSKGTRVYLNFIELKVLNENNIKKTSKGYFL